MSDKFNLKDYETVKVRKQRFYEKFPDGRIIVDCIEADKDHALFKCSLYKNCEEQMAGQELSTGYAMEFRGVGSFANKHAWVENCEESAVGRATDNAGFATNLKCSLEEIKKVEVAKAADSEGKGSEERQHPKSTYPKPVYGVCPLCDGWMHLSKSGKKIYCENWAQKDDGEHPSFNFIDQPVLPEEIRAGVDAKDKAREFFEKSAQDTQQGDIPF